MSKQVYCRFYSIILGLGLSLAGCTSDDPQIGNEEGSGTETTQPSDGQQSSDPYIPGNLVKTYSFDLDFFKSAIESYDGNIIVSPLAAHMAFGIVAAGSSSATASEIVNLLKCIDLKYMQAFHSEVVNSFPTLDSKSVTELSSSLWHTSEFNVNSEFSDIFLDTYGGRLFPCDMNSSDTREAISTWCNEHTRKTVSGVSVPDDEDLLLLSSIYFKSPWSSSLKKDMIGSTVGAFYGLSGEKECNLVKLLGYMGHTSAKDGSYEAVKVDLGNGSFTATFVLPDYDTDVSEVLGNINYRYLIDQNATDMDGTHVWKRNWTHLFLPVFEASATAYDLSEVFDKMGISDILVGAFDNIVGSSAESRLLLSQTSALQFTDDGMEAAAVLNDIRPTDNINFPDDTAGEWMDINRPYIFFIHETTTGACILAGKITDI